METGYPITPQYSKFLLLLSLFNATLLVKLLVGLLHPFRKFLQSLIDQWLGHFPIEGVCHRTGDCSQRVSIAAKGYGEAQTVYIVFRRKETDYCRTDASRASRVEGIGGFYFFISIMF